MLNFLTFWNFEYLHIKGVHWLLRKAQDHPNYKDCQGIWSGRGGIVVIVKLIKSPNILISIIFFSNLLPYAQWHYQQIMISRCISNWARRMTQSSGTFLTLMQARPLEEDDDQWSMMLIMMIVLIHKKVLECLLKDTWTISDQTDVILLNENSQILSLWNKSTLSSARDVDVKAQRWFSTHWKYTVKSICASTKARHTISFFGVSPLFPRNPYRQNWSKLSI